MLKLLLPAIAVAVLSYPAGALAAAAGAQGPSPAACRTLDECRQLALAAADKGEYQQFHDLAWRAVQAGPPNDPALLYLLARAQCLSGRPHDALVMLRRLAEAGFETDADTSADFIRTRELPAWSDVEPLIAEVHRTGKPIARSTSAPARSPGRNAAAREAASVATAPVARPAQVDNAARFSAGGFVAGGLAYDAVSKRFVVGDATGRKLMVVTERSDHATDMVRADSAGFQDVVAVEIDERRGDLWVASAATSGGQSALHRLQLVSGRPLRTYKTPASEAQLVDLAISGAGSIVALDRTANQLLVLKRGETTFESVVKLTRPGAVSVTTTADEAVAYVAGTDGISRVDLRARTSAAVAAPAGVDLGHFERIRAYRGSLIGIEPAAGGTRRVVRLDLSGNGRAITAATVIDASIPETRGATFATISGDELYYLTADASGTSGAPVGSAAAPLADFVVRRVSLR